MAEIENMNNYNDYNYDENYELEIESISNLGHAIARKNGIVHFVKGGVPGDRIEAALIRKKRNYLESKIVKLIEPSVHRCEPVCSHFGVCGGCSLQMMDYQTQIEWKRIHIIEAFERIAKIDVHAVHQTMPSPNIFNYRNKMEFSFCHSRWLTKEEIESGNDIPNKDFALGLHIKERYDKVVNIDKCWIHTELGEKILNIFRNKAIEMGLSAFEARPQIGFLRNLIIRTSEANKELMLILHSNYPQITEETEFCDWFEKDLPNELPEATNLILTFSDARSPIAYGKPYVTKGKDYITEVIQGINFRISPFSFFQTNSGQLNNFVGKILEMAEIDENKTVWDLFCGTGSISLPAAKIAKTIIGMELVESSVLDAKKNAKLNKITNAEFFTCDLNFKQVPDYFSKLSQPDIVIVDPPRAGLHNNLVNHLLTLAPERIVYVSCNPATQARDCAILEEKYSIEQIQPVDMFPHTFHTESIAKLVRK